jgi:hypothetical protein
VTIANHMGANGFTGTIDEVRISSTARTAGWITTSYTNQSNPPAIYVTGAEENAPTTATVTTNNATAVEETIATLQGYLNNDGGLNCQYSFEWGTAPGSYTSNISWTGSINTGANFSTDLVGLTKGQPYYFRAKVKNEAGVTNGLEVHFLTKPDGPAALTATANSSSRIDLAWTMGDGAQRIMIRRSTTGYPPTRFDGAQVYFGGGTGYTDMSLTGNTTYYYSGWSEVTGSQQFSNTSASANATTFLAPPLPPGVIGGKVFSVNKAVVLAPWLVTGFLAALILTRIVLYLRKRIVTRQPPHKNS